MVVPSMLLLSKEVSFDPSVTYQERAFRETVDAFAAGKFIARILASRGKYKGFERNCHLDALYIPLAALP